MSRRGIGGGGGGGGGTSVTALLDLDLTTLPAVASFATGTHTIGGMTWTVDRGGAGAASSTVKLNTPAATGLVLSSADAANDFNLQVALPLAQFGADVYALRKPVTAWFRQEHVVPASDNCQTSSAVQYGTALGDASTLGARLFRARVGGNQSWFPYGEVVSSATPAYGSVVTTTDLAHDVKVVRFTSLFEVEFYSGAWAGGTWPAWNTLTNRSPWRYGGASWPSGSPPGASSLSLSAYMYKPGGVVSAMSTSLKALRVEVG